MCVCKFTKYQNNFIKYDFIFHFNHIHVVSQSVESLAPQFITLFTVQSFIFFLNSCDIR